MLVPDGDGGVASAAGAGAAYDDDAMPAGGGGGGEWGDDDDLDLDDEGGGGKKVDADGGGGGTPAAVPGAWGDDDDLDLGDDDVPAPKSGGGGSGGGGGGDFFAAPAAGTSALTQWCNNSSHASDHIAAGAFEGAMTLLNRQVAIVNFKPLKSKFVGIWAGAYASVPGLPLAPALRSPLQRNARDKPPPDGKSLPAVPLKLNVLIEKLKGESRVLFPGREMIYSYHHT